MSIGRIHHFWQFISTFTVLFLICQCSASRIILVGFFFFLLGDGGSGGMAIMLFSLQDKESLHMGIFSHDLHTLIKSPSALLFDNQTD